MSVFEDKKFIAKKLREYRKSAGYTQGELAEKIGLGEKQICKIENGANVPSLITFLKLVEVLNINLDDFGVKFEKQDNKKREKLEKFIYNLNEKELDFYLNCITTIKSQYETYFKK